LKAKEQLATANRIRQRLLVAFKPDLTADELEVHNIIASQNKPELKAKRLQARGWLRQLRQINDETHQYPEPAFSRCIAKRELWVYNQTRSPIQRKVRRIIGRVLTFRQR